MPQKQSKHKGLSSNPHNPRCSASLQMLLDLQSVGDNSAELQFLIKKYQADTIESRRLLSRADDLYNKHQYPDDRLSFAMVLRDSNICKLISGNAMSLLTFMTLNINTRNLLLLSIADITTYTNLASNGTAHRALKELLETGCIAVKAPKSKDHGTIYMLNPAIVVIGKLDNHRTLTKVFWRLTGSQYDDNGKLIGLSGPHKAWLGVMDETPYTRGTESMRINDEVVRTNKLNGYVASSAAADGTATTDDDATVD